MPDSQIEILNNYSPSNIWKQHFLFLQEKVFVSNVLVKSLILPPKYTSKLNCYFFSYFEVNHGPNQLLNSNPSGIMFREAICQFQHVMSAKRV